MAEDKDIPWYRKCPNCNTVMSRRTGKRLHEDLSVRYYYCSKCDKTESVLVQPAKVLSAKFRD